jgi:hypothetical protein
VVFTLIGFIVFALSFVSNIVSFELSKAWPRGLYFLALAICFTVWVALVTYLTHQVIRVLKRIPQMSDAATRAEQIFDERKSSSDGGGGIFMGSSRAGGRQGSSLAASSDADGSLLDVSLDTSLLNSYSYSAAGSSASSSVQHQQGGGGGGPVSDPAWDAYSGGGAALYDGALVSEVPSGQPSAADTIRRLYVLIILVVCFAALCVPFQTIRAIEAFRDFSKPLELASYHVGNLVFASVQLSSALLIVWYSWQETRGCCCCCRGHATGRRSRANSWASSVASSTA